MLCQGNAIFYRPKDKALHADNSKATFARPAGDHLALLQVYTQWAECNYSYQWCFQNYIQFKSIKRARDIKDQLIKLCERVEIDVTDPALSTHDDEFSSNIVKCLLSGYFYNVAKITHPENNLYKTLKNPHSVMLHP